MTTIHAEDWLDDDDPRADSLIHHSRHAGPHRGDMAV
jgi:hypothetical protein